MYLLHDIITYKKQEILFLNYKDLGDEELIKTMQHNSNEMVIQGKRDRLMIIDVTNVEVTKSALACCKQVAPLIEPFTKKIAVLGVPPILKGFLNFIASVFDMELHFFTDMALAKEWLVNSQ